MSDQVRNLEDWFSHDEAQIKCVFIDFAMCDLVHDVETIFHLYSSFRKDLHMLLVVNTGHV